MTDDRTKKGVQDRTRINTSEDYELRYWSEKFGVSQDQFKTYGAIDQGGPAALRPTVDWIVCRGPGQAHAGIHNHTERPTDRLTDLGTLFGKPLGAVSWEECVV